MIIKYKLNYTQSNSFHKWFYKNDSTEPALSKKD